MPASQDSLKPEGLQMNENKQNDRVLYRYLSQEEEQNVISEIKQDPLFSKHADTIVSVLAESGINFNDIVDSIRTNNPNMNSNNLKVVAMQVIENNPNIKENLREFALEQHYQCLIYIEQHEILRFVYLDQSLMVLHNALVQYIQESGKYNKAGEYLVINTVGNCVLEAVGVNALADAWGGKITSKITKQAVKKVASKAVPVLGWAVAAYDFGSCMSWW